MACVVTSSSADKKVIIKDDWLRLLPAICGLEHSRSGHEIFNVLIEDLQGTVEDMWCGIVYPDQ